MTAPRQKDKSSTFGLGQEPIKIITHPPEAIVRHLLTEAGLPTADTTPEHLESFLALESESGLVGILGLELYGEVALLRSLTVVPHRRVSGLGSALVEHAERFAKDRGVRYLHLLTNTAERFFERLGYAQADRKAAPTSIRGTAEFSGICPVSSTFMVEHLSTDLSTRRLFPGR